MAAPVPWQNLETTHDPQPLTPQRDLGRACRSAGRVGPERPPDCREAARPPDARSCQQVPEAAEGDLEAESQDVQARTPALPTCPRTILQPSAHHGRTSRASSAERALHALFLNDGRYSAG